MRDPHPTSGYDPRLFAKLLEAEDRHFWFVSRNRVLADVLAGLSVGDGKRVLEIGTGTGNTLKVLERACTRATVVGVDLFEEGLAIARRRTTARLVRAKIEQLPFRRPFDLIAAFDVLEHVEDDRAALANVRQLLAPDGRLFLTVPASARLWSRFDEESHHCRRYEAAQLRERLVEAGYRIERLTFFMASLYPLVRVARLVSDRTRDGGDTVARELRVVPVANSVLTAILSLEARLLAAGVRLPVGTSLLAVARAS
jgi:SAM-dependent methyltransferase